MPYDPPDAQPDTVADKARDKLPNYFSHHRTNAGADRCGESDPCSYSHSCSHYVHTMQHRCPEHYRNRSYHRGDAHMR